MWGLTLITLLRIPYLGRIGSTKLELPKWHKYGILNRVIRVVDKILAADCLEKSRGYTPGELYFFISNFIQKCLQKVRKEFTPPLCKAKKTDVTLSR